MRSAEEQLQDRLNRLRREAEAELEENASDHSAAMYAERIIAAIDCVEKRHARGQGAAALLAMMELADLSATFAAHRHHERLGIKKPLRQRLYFAVDVFGEVRGLLARAFVQKDGGNAANAEWRKAEKKAVEVARAIWANDNDQDCDKVYVIRVCHDELNRAKLKDPADRKLWEWITNSDIIIPEYVTRPGRKQKQ